MQHGNNYRGRATAAMAQAEQTKGGRNQRFLPPLESPFFPCRSELTSRMHKVLVIPPARPSQAGGNTTTVLAGKGALRRAKSRRALAPCAPLWPPKYSDGRLRRDHEEEACFVGHGPTSPRTCYEFGGRQPTNGITFTQKT